MNVRCYHGKHLRGVMISATAILMCTLGFPVYIFLSLRRAKAKGKLYATADKTNELQVAHPSTRHLKAMFIKYEARCYWFECLHLWYKALFAGPAVARAARSRCLVCGAFVRILRGVWVLHADAGARSGARVV